MMRDGRAVANGMPAGAHHIHMGDPNARPAACRQTPRVTGGLVDRAMRRSHRAPHPGATWADHTMLARRLRQAGRIGRVAPANLRAPCDRQGHYAEQPCPVRTADQGKQGQRHYVSPHRVNPHGAAPRCASRQSKPPAS